ncbi:unnamed protein product [Amoebophrya sp. A25]|nr:unnamed protein product [Amoebophrya sp. A25]|eukprot:GSA25T00007633001.1
MRSSTKISPSGSSRPSANAGAPKARKESNNQSAGQPKKRRQRVLIGGREYFDEEDDSDYVPEARDEEEDEENDANANWFAKRRKKEASADGHANRSVVGHVSEWESQVWKKNGTFDPSTEAEFASLLAAEQHRGAAERNERCFFGTGIGSRNFSWTGVSSNCEDKVYKVLLQGAQAGRKGPETNPNKRSNSASTARGRNLGNDVRFRDAKWRKSTKSGDIHFFAQEPRETTTLTFRTMSAICSAFKSTTSKSTTNTTGETKREENQRPTAKSKDALRGLLLNEGVECGTLLVGTGKAISSTSSRNEYHTSLPTLQARVPSTKQIAASSTMSSSAPNAAACEDRKDTSNKKTRLSNPPAASNKRKSLSTNHEASKSPSKSTSVSISRLLSRINDIEAAGISSLSFRNPDLDYDLAPGEIERMAEAITAGRARADALRSKKVQVEQINSTSCLRFERPNPELPASSAARGRGAKRRSSLAALPAETGAASSTTISARIPSRVRLGERAKIDHASIRARIDEAYINHYDRAADRDAARKTLQFQNTVDDVAMSAAQREAAKKATAVADNKGGTSIDTSNASSGGPSSSATSNTARDKSASNTAKIKDAIGWRGDGMSEGESEPAVSAEEKEDYELLKEFAPELLIPIRAILGVGAHNVFSQNQIRPRVQTYLAASAQAAAKTQAKRDQDPALSRRQQLLGSPSATSSFHPQLASPDFSFAKITGEKKSIKHAGASSSSKHGESDSTTFELGCKQDTKTDTDDRERMNTSCSGGLQLAPVTEAERSQPLAKELSAVEQLRQAREELVASITETALTVFHKQRKKWNLKDTMFSSIVEFCENSTGKLASILNRSEEDWAAFCARNNLSDQFRKERQTGYLVDQNFLKKIAADKTKNKPTVTFLKD